MMSIVGGVPIMSSLSLCTLVFYLCQFFRPPDYYDPPGYLIPDFPAPWLLPPPFYSGLQSMDSIKFDNHLSANEIGRVKALITDYNDIFALNQKNQKEPN